MVAAIIIIIIPVLLRIRQMDKSKLETAHAKKAHVFVATQLPNVS